jgi:hypothetical protein
MLVSSVLLQVAAGGEHLSTISAGDFLFVWSIFADTQVFLQIGFACKAKSTSSAMEVSFSLVMNSSPVVFQCAFVAEWCSADVTVENMSCMSC